MPVADFTPEFKRAADNDFEKLKLKLNEKARIVLLEKPHFEWVHTLRAPKIVSGQPVMVERKRGGEAFMDYDLDFIGRPLCLGDQGILADDAVDPKNCPVCARAKESDEVAAPERRFAVNIVRYGLQRDGATLTDPFTCTCVVWAFPEGRYNQLYSIAQEHKNSGGIVGLDLILGPCQAPESYQKYEIMPGSQNVWQASDSIRDTVLKTYQNNKVDNLEGACGRKTERKWINDDLDKIKNRWRTARNDTAGDEVHGDKPDLSTGLSDLMNTTRVNTLPNTGSSSSGSDVTYSFSSGADAEEKKAEPQSDVMTAPANNFQSLLSQLNIS